MVVNNYAGDRLNFGLAMEHARTKDLAHKCFPRDISDRPSSRPSYLGQKRNVDRIQHAHNLSRMFRTYTMFRGKGASTPPSAPSPTLSRAKCLDDAPVVHLRSIGGALGHCHVPGCEPHSDSTAPLSIAWINLCSFSTDYP